MWAAVVMYGFFLLLEVGVPLLALWRCDRRQPMLWAVAATLALCPLFAVGQASDFCMRASIPALMALMVLCLRALLDARRVRRFRPAIVALALCLLLGAATPLTEVKRGALAVAQAGRLGLVADDIGTLSDKITDFDNFLTFNAQERPFFRYLAR